MRQILTRVADARKFIDNDSIFAVKKDGIVFVFMEDAKIPIRLDEEICLDFSNVNYYNSFSPAAPKPAVFAFRLEKRHLRVLPKLV